MKNKVTLIAAILLVIIIVFFAVCRFVPKESLAAFFAATTSMKDFQSEKKIHILIVPGHEPDFGGTEYDGLKERDIVVLFAEEIEKALEKNKRFDVMVARDERDWNPKLKKYFEDNWNAIEKWQQGKKAETIRLVDQGVIKEFAGVEHLDAPQEQAIRLYGMNKWANENDIDIVLHLHINDIPRKDTSVPGPYTGFTVYVPEKQYSNATTSRELGIIMKEELEKDFSPSNYGRETGGLSESQELIAMGRYGTLDQTAILIEYGYIYEPMFAAKSAQKKSAKAIAKRTYNALTSFLDQE